MGSTRVSVIIPYYKRGEVFARGLDTVLSQDYENKEIIVVDNHSEDDLKQRVLARQAGVKLIELPENEGACVARNTGGRAASGDIFVILDDDAGFMSPRELSKLVRILDNRPDVHVIAFQICDPVTGQLNLRDWCHPRYWKDFAQSEFETDHFGEGASAFRREVFEKTGGYYEKLFYGAEGLDMELRIMDEGFKILYTPEVRVWHQVSGEARTNERQYYYFTRNYVWMAYRDYPFWAGARFLSFKLAMMLYLTLRVGSYRSFVRGLWDGVTGLHRIRLDRKPISRNTMKRWLKLERGRPGILLRLARHRSNSQL
ncbi:MAG TPA: glycosyltransferase family 2 protein [Candidatus Acidoferrales bacterium]|nr:glycosyltransferase family 2 protein [Candidatus Acidoferrales bacterium]